MNKKLAIIGAGGHGKVVGEIALLNEYKIVDFFDDRANEINDFPFNVVDTLNYLKEHQNEYDDLKIAYNYTRGFIKSGAAFKYIKNIQNV